MVEDDRMVKVRDPKPEAGEGYPNRAARYCHPIKHLHIDAQLDNKILS